MSKQAALQSSATAVRGSSGHLLGDAQLLFEQLVLMLPLGLELRLGSLHEVLSKQAGSACMT